MSAPLQALILSEGYTASTDYFIRPHLQQLGYAVSLLDSRPPNFNANPNPCALFVISRYISTAQLAWLEKHRPAKVVYFMDDDLFDIQALQGLPWRYQWKIFTLVLKHRSRLLVLCDEIWVSTPYLAAKYAHLQPLLLNPVMRITSASPSNKVQVCYHGTASHSQEIAWLIPIVASVQAQTDNIHFEFFGTPSVTKAFKQIPRVSVLHPMNWPNYLAFTSLQKRDIALAPLLDNAFNAARGATKFYDYARMEAVGLYSNVPPYQGFIHDGRDGFLLDNHPDLWIEKILQLTNDVSKRQAMQEQIKHRLN